MVGGGAAGLACALACARKGLLVRVIDKRPERSAIQKATGVAQGVWHQLALVGIGPEIIGDAAPMKRFVFHDEGRMVADVRVPLVDGEPPARMYPQADLERAMEHSLASFGVNVEYGLSFETMSRNADSAIVTIRRPDGSVETAEADWLVAADGGRSEVRRHLGVPFVGRDYPENWSVAETTTGIWPAETQAQLFLDSDGVGLFLSRPAPGVVQGILNAPGVGGRLLARFPDAVLSYERDFSVSLRRVLTPRLGRVWFIGDAAHVQSPVGGQGLNLAIWDGMTLGAALVDGELGVEKTLRDRACAVLRFTDFDYRMLATRSRLVRHLRNSYWRFASGHPWSARWFFKIISGVW